MDQADKSSKPIPVWICALAVVLLTGGSFWFFGGANYIAHRAAIDYAHFHHEEDMTNLLAWSAYFAETGVTAAIGTMILSTSVLIHLRKWLKKSARMPSQLIH
jgi:hypothetical protein